METFSDINLCFLGYTSKKDVIVDHALIKNVGNFSLFRPADTSFNLTLTIILGEETVSEIIKESLELILLPFKVHIDFFAIMSSETMSNRLMWPSIGTASNKVQIIEDDDDLEDLCDEFAEAPLEKILMRHNSVRQESRNASTSGQKISKLLAVTFYITKFNDIIVH